MTTVNVRYHLLIGRGYARTIGELSESLDLPRRVIEEAVQQARLNGVPVISGSEGLWIAQNGQEALSMADRLQRRLVAQYLTVRAMRETGRRMQRAEQSIEPLTLGLEAA